VTDRADRPTWGPRRTPRSSIVNRASFELFYSDVMAYDARAESLVLIDSRLVEPVLRLSRRRRFAPMSIYVAGDMAVTTFARRGVGCTWHDRHVFALQTSGQWVFVGGSGSNGQDDLLKGRPAVLPAYLSSQDQSPGEDDPGPIAAEGGGGGVHDGTGSGPGRWISTADVRVNAQVESIVVDDRQLAVPWHGRVAVVWTGPQPPEVVALDRHGHPLASVLLPTAPWEPNPGST
jgi:hypothetical protein